MTFTVERLITGCIGYARTEEGRGVFLPGTLPGEVVEVSSFHDKKSYLDAKELEVISASDKRISSSCPYKGICGGCDFDFVSAEDSAFFKEQIVKDNIRNAGIENLDFLPTVFGSADNYRSRIRLHVSLKENKAGFLKAGCNELVEVKHCLRLEERLNELLESGSLLKTARSRAIEKGINRKTGYVELNLFNADDRVLIERDEGVRSIDGIPYHLSGNVFFQSNPSLLTSLFAFVKENAVGDSLMDLYSGVGTFSALFPDKKVIAVERQKECLRLAALNAPHAKAFSDDVAVWGRRRRDVVDTVIVDPPRSGLDKGVPEMISSWKAERIIYVSCNSQTLSRDLPHFEGYKPIKAQVFDFYPGSGHEESAVAMERID